MIDLLASLVPANLAAHAPALLVLVPMFVAPLAAVMPSGRLAWLATILATGFSLLMAIVLLAQVQSVEGGAVSPIIWGVGHRQPGLSFASMR